MGYNFTAVEDNISILSTPYFPDKEEASALTSRLQTREETIQALDRQIQELYAQRDSLHQRSTIGQALLAPIRRLPTETLAEIFLLCIPPVHNHQFEPLPFRVHHPALVRQCLGEVCHRWRNVIQDTPRAWSAIVLDHPLPADLSRVQRLLQRSKSCPLDIYLDPRAWDYDTIPSPDRIRAVMKLLRGEVNRFRSFFADMKYTRQAEEFLHDLFPCGETSSALNMEVFGVQTVHHYENMGAIISPKLQSLDLWGTMFPLTSFALSPLPSLRQLRLKIRGQSYTSDVYLPFLAQCPQLESLHLDYPSEIQEDRPKTSQPPKNISLPALKTLSLTSFDAINAQYLFQSLDIPLLETLHLGLYSAVPISMDWILGGRHRPEVAASLQHLTLENLDLTGSDGSQWPWGLPNLRTMRIGKGCTLDATLSVLCPPNSTSPDSWACPNLEMLVLDRATLRGDDLVRLVHGRTQPDGEERSPGYLKSLEVLNCIGLERNHLQELDRVNRSSFKLSHNMDWSGWGFSTEDWD